MRNLQNIVVGMMRRHPPELAGPGYSPLQTDKSTVGNLWIILISRISWSFNNFPITTCFYAGFLLSLSCLLLDSEDGGDMFLHYVG
jgi:hypothetical protein